MSTLEERLDKIEGAIKQKSFRQNKGLGNEVGYYVFDYDPKKELFVREQIEYIKNKINKAGSGFQIVEFDLYNIMIDILSEKGYLEKCFQFEATKGFGRVKKSIGNMLRITDDESMVIDYIKGKIPENAVIFLTGVGKCYPIIRSHTILNNLHNVADNVPVVMFYPGKYDGQELMLFSEIKDDNYYRAFRLVD